MWLPVLGMKYFSSNFDDLQAGLSWSRVVNDRRIADDRTSKLQVAVGIGIWNRIGDWTGQVVP